MSVGGRCSSGAAGCWPRINVNITLFSRVTLISKVQSTSDLDYFHARDLPCSHVKSHDDPISDCQGDSAEWFPYIIYRLIKAKEATRGTIVLRDILLTWSNFLSRVPGTANTERQQHSRTEVLWSRVLWSRSAVQSRRSWRE